MIEDLTMLATLPVCEDETAVKAQLEADKAAAAETLPAPKETHAGSHETDAGRVARRGQDQPEPDPGNTDTARG